MRPVLAHLAAFPVSGEAQFRAVDGAMPHWSHIGDTRPPSLVLEAVKAQLSRLESQHTARTQKLEAHLARLEAAA